MTVIKVSDETKNANEEPPVVAKIKTIKVDTFFYFKTTYLVRSFLKLKKYLIS